MPRSFLLRRSPSGQEKLQSKGRNVGVLAERFVNGSFGKTQSAKPATFWLVGDRKRSMHENVNSLTSYTYQSYIDGDLMESKNASQGLSKNERLQDKSKGTDNGSKLVAPTFIGELDGSEGMAQTSTAIPATVGTKPIYKCEQCGKTFKTKYTLTIHLKMPNHTGARPFVCNICGKGFRLSSTLCRHKIIHTSEKPHQCHICQKAFNRSSTLKTHIRTHSEKKEFLCDVCGKGFHQKGNLRNHFLIHTGEKPYRCRLCNKAFNKLSNLKFHLHVHTDNTPYRCRYCKTAFSRRCDLKQHIRENHNEDMSDYYEGQEEV